MITETPGLAKVKVTSLTIPLTIADRQLAQVMAAAQPHPAAQAKVYANTLAVQALQTYCRWMDVAVDRDQSRSQNQPQTDVADLYLPEISQRLECCVVRPGATHCQIPAIAQTGRLGYMAVELDAQGYEARLVGFLPATKFQRLLPHVPNGTISLAQFEDLEVFLDALAPQWTNLSAWLQGQFATHWQALQTLTAPAPAVRCLPIVDAPDKPVESGELDRLTAALATVADDDEETRWKLVERLWSLNPEHPAAGVRRGVDLGLSLDGAAIALVLSILPKPNGEMAILLRVYPTHDRHLPAGLKLAGLYESGDTFLDAIARDQDNYIQLKFSAQLGERFGVRVQLGDVVYLEHFIA